MMTLVEPAIRAQMLPDVQQRRMPTSHDDAGGTSYNGTDAT